MNSHGRPNVKPLQLRDGFYIEVCNKGNAKGIKIRSASLATMEEAAQRYAIGKDVIILGEYKDGIAVNPKSKS